MGRRGWAEQHDLTSCLPSPPLNKPSAFVAIISPLHHHMPRLSATFCPQHVITPFRHSAGQPAGKR